MDGQRFDDLSRSLIGRGTRRGILGRAIAVALGGAVIAASEDRASANARRTCRAEGTGCTRNSQCCGGTCNTDRKAPRALRNRCACVPVCPDGYCGDDGCGGSCGACTGSDVCGSDDYCRLACSDPDIYDETNIECGLTTEGNEIVVCNLTKPGGSTNIPCESSAYCQEYLGIPNVYCLVAAGGHYVTGEPDTWNFAPYDALCIQDYSADVCS